MTRRRADFGTLRKLNSGRWQARYTDRSGVRRSRTFPTRGDASRFLAGTRADLDRGTWVDPTRGRGPLADYASRWVDARRVRGRPLAPRTVALYRWQLDRHILPMLGTVALRHLDTATVRQWWATMTGPAGPGAATAAKCYRLLRAVCGTAVADGEMIRNPCTLRGAGQEPSSERPSVSVPEVVALADAVGLRWRALVLLAAFSGLRFGELAALTRADVDLLRGTVRVRASVAELPGGLRHVGPPKSAAGRRIVNVPPHVLPELVEHLAAYAAPGPEGLVFVGPKGGPLRPANFGAKVWRPATRAAGLAGVHFHDLRGTAATLAAVSGATTAELMRRLGHTTPDVAMRYQRASDDRDATLARLMSEAVLAPVRAIPNSGTARAPLTGAQTPRSLGTGGAFVPCAAGMPVTVHGFVRSH